MNALEKALAQIAQGEAEQRDGHPDHFSRAAVYAAIAQAEQLKRIADALESVLEPPGERTGRRAIRTFDID